MASKSSCLQCLRILRMQAKQRQPVPRNNTILRSISTSLSAREQAPQPKTKDEPSEILIGPFTTASTVTTNVTAPLPDTSTSSSTAKSKAKPSIPNVSVSEMQRQIASSLQKPDLATQLAQKIRKTARATTETYITYGLTESYFNSCSAQAAYMIPENQRMEVISGKGPPKTAGEEDLGMPDKEAEDSWWFNELGLEPTFSTWSQVTYLHMYILTVRLRDLDTVSSFQNYQRYLLEHFSHMAEDKMVIYHNMNARGIRNRYLKDLFLQWRGILAAYDEGLVKGDAVLGAAVWRNLYKAQEDVDWTRVALIVAYMRKAINLLGRIEVSEISGSLDGPQGLWALSQSGLTEVVNRQGPGNSEAHVD